MMPRGARVTDIGKEWTAGWRSFTPRRAGDDSDAEQDVHHKGDAAGFAAGAQDLDGLGRERDRESGWRPKNPNKIQSSELTAPPDFQRCIHSSLFQRRGEESAVSVS